MDLWTLKWHCIEARNDSIMEIIAYVHMRSLEIFAGLI